MSERPSDETYDSRRSAQIWAATWALLTDYKEKHGASFSWTIHQAVVEFIDRKEKRTKG